MKNLVIALERAEFVSEHEKISKKQSTNEFLPSIAPSSEQRDSKMINY